VETVYGTSRVLPDFFSVSPGLFTTYREVVPDISSRKSVTFPVLHEVEVPKILRFQQEVVRKSITPLRSNTPAL